VKRHGLSLPPTPLGDAVELLAFLVMLCGAGAVLWVWEEIGMLWEVRAAIYLTAFAGLPELFLLSVLHLLRLLNLCLIAIIHVLRLFRKVRRAWKRTFPRRATRHARRPRRHRG